MPSKKKKQPKRVSNAAKRKALIARLSSQYPHYNLISNMFGFFFIASLSLSIWEVGIYRQTIIPFSIPLAVYFSTGVAITPLLKRLLNIYVFNPYNPGHLPIFFHVFYNIVTWGGITLFGLMWVNYHLAGEQTKYVSLTIQSSGHFAKGKHGCGEGYVNVIYNGSAKELVFSCSTQVEIYKLVHLETAMGFLGFEIIKGQELRNGDW